MSSDRRQRQNAETLSFRVELKKSSDYFDRQTQRHIRRNFPENYVFGGEAELSDVPCKKR